MSKEAEKKPWFTTQVGSVISKEDYYKNVYPKGFISTYPGLASFSMIFVHLYQNKRSAVPLTSGSHRMILATTACYFTFWKVEELYGRYIMGKYKYALDYLLNCEDNTERFSTPKKFSDPDHLQPFIPVRVANNAIKPITTLKIPTEDES